MADTPETNAVPNGTAPQQPKNAPANLAPAKQPAPATAGTTPQRADEIMSQHVVTVLMDQSLREIREVFERYKFRHVPVIEDGVLVGVISDRDVLSHVSPFVGKFTERSQDTNSLRLKAHQVMTREPVTAGGDTPIVELGMLMLQHTISCVPIVDNEGACIGIVTSRDVLRWCLRSGCGVKPQPAKEPKQSTPAQPAKPSPAAEVQDGRSAA